MGGGIDQFGSSSSVLDIPYCSAFPNTWEHTCDEDNDCLPPYTPHSYKYYVNISMDTVNRELMQKAKIRFDSRGIEFVQPQPENAMTMMTRMYAFSYLMVRQIACIYSVTVRKYVSYCALPLLFFIFYIQILFSHQ